MTNRAARTSQERMRLLREEIDLLKKVEGRKAEVLAVDDEQSMRLIMARALRALGFKRIHRAAHGEAALGLLAKTPCGLALVDWNMPRMDGLELLDRVRSNPGLAGMVFIMVTVEARDARVMQAAEEKHDAYLTKPISSEKLARRLEAVLARRLTMARAGLLEAEGQVDRAMEEYLAMANNHPRASWPLSCLGRMLVRQGRAEEAETCYQRVLDRNPRAAWARLELGRLLQAQGRIGEARGQYQEALLNAPRFFKAYDALAESILEQGDRRGALEVMEAAVSSLGAQSAGRQELLARLRYLNRQYAGAEEAYARALALKPHGARVGSRLGLGRCRLAQGRLEEALPALEEAAACCRGERDLEDLIDLRLLMGAVHAQRGDLEAAARAFAEMADPAAWPGGRLPFEAGDLHREAGAVYLDADLVDQAMEHFAASLAQKPGDQANRAAIEKLCRGAGLGGAGQVATAAAARRRDREVEAASRRGLALAAAGRLDEALSEYQKGLDLDPGSGRLRYNMARVHLRARREEQARALMAAAARRGLERRDWELVVETAGFFAGRAASQAEALLRRVLEQEPDHPEAREALAEILQLNSQSPSQRTPISK